MRTAELQTKNLDSNFSQIIEVWKPESETLATSYGEAIHGIPINKRYIDENGFEISEEETQIRLFDDTNFKSYFVAELYRTYTWHPESKFSHFGYKLELTSATNTQKIILEGGPTNFIFSITYEGADGTRLHTYKDPCRVDGGADLIEIDTQGQIAVEIIIKDIDDLLQRIVGNLITP